MNKRKYEKPFVVTDEVLLEDVVLASNFINVEESNESWDGDEFGKYGGK